MQRSDQGPVLASNKQRLGVMVVGLNGAVSTTLVAGVHLMRKGVVQPIGMLSEAGELAEILPFVPLESLVFGGWDLNGDNAYQAALQHKVFRADQLEPVKAELEQTKPWKAVFSKEYAERLEGKHVVTKGSFREQIAAVQADIERFRKENKLDRVVMVNLASTETWIEPAPVHQTLAAFEQGLDRNDPAISPAMRYLYAAFHAGVPHANFAPSLANVPALQALAEERGVPYTGMDGKTGQTLVKTALASMFRARRLLVDGWYSTNFLGNNDGKVLDAPGSNKTKVMSKASVLDSILGYRVENHQVHIHYYKPRGDAKEAWDNIDLVGFGGVPMQMKVNFLCQDSILAAPLVVDLVRLLDVAARAGERGIQRQLSMYFKSPYHAPGEQPEHDFFKQENMLLQWARATADKLGRGARESQTGGRKKALPNPAETAA